MLDILSKRVFLKRVFTVLAVPCLLMLSACAEMEPINSGSVDFEASGRGHYKVGSPYQIKGRWYHPSVDYDYEETGVASWYGPGFDGQKTANGEVYNQDAMTAAHRTLPMPSFVLVTNLENDRSVILRVNDRGPFAHSRIIDVSRKAASMLGFRIAGTTKVRVTILPDESRKIAKLAGGDRGRGWIPPGIAPQTSPMNNRNADVLNSSAVQKNIFVQVGAFGQLHNAYRLQSRLSSLGPSNVSEVKIGARTLYRVRIGPLESPEEADQIVERILNSGFDDARIITKEPL